MKTFYSMAGGAAFSFPSAVVFPVVMLVAVVTGVAGLVVGIGRWKIRHGYLTRFKAPKLSKHNVRRRMTSTGTSFVSSPSSSA